MNDEGTKSIAFLSALAGLGTTLLMFFLNSLTWTVNHDTALKNRETSAIKQKSATIEHEKELIARDIEREKLEKLKEERLIAARAIEPAPMSPQKATAPIAPNPVPQVVKTQPTVRRTEVAVAQPSIKQKAKRASSSLPVLAHSPPPAMIRRPDGRMMVLRSRR